ncbi:MAG TPA: hypothetical protein VEU51_13515 [Candidatus Acidoferrales bacterium]|nr:hypothetical protein [Candidatus Acidoferrales bacterium]
MEGWSDQQRRTIAEWRDFRAIGNLETEVVWVVAGEISATAKGTDSIVAGAAVTRVLSVRLESMLKRMSLLPLGQPS